MTKKMGWIDILPVSKIQYPMKNHYQDNPGGCPDAWPTRNFTRGVLTKDYRLMTNDCKKKEARIEIQPRFKSNIL
jgi:hypothetical protein